VSDALLLGIGTLIFTITVWATLVVGYYQFGKWYDRDQSDEIERRTAANSAAAAEGRPPTERPALEVSHDHPEELAAARAARSADS
jgi:hypothetical protein